MGRTHLAAYASARSAGVANRIVAVCDPRIESLDDHAGGNLDAGKSEVDLGLEGAARVGDFDAFLANPAVEVVSLCTPTDTHVPLAMRALEAGKHVLVEKPVATSSADVRRLADAARSSGKLCMPAMCMRFWPGWDWLRERVASGELGRVKSAVFRRLAAPPGWSADFYANAERTGGALFDLHIHDVDFLTWCFGVPATVTSHGTRDHVATLYGYTDGPELVLAEGGWDHTSGFEFHMHYTVVFERATATFTLGADPVLTLAREGESTPVELESAMGYDGEVAHLLRAIAAGANTISPSLEDALRVTHVLEAEAASLERGIPVEPAS